MPTPHHSINGAPIALEGVPSGEDVRSIGEIIRDTRNLSAEQVQQILEHQKANGLKFGEAAIGLGFATPDDVLHALAQQFSYSLGNAARQESSPELVTLNQPFSRQAEAFRALRAQIMMRTHPDGVIERSKRRALAVLSPDTADGKTFFSSNLAIALAQLGERTVIVDADMRGPRVHEVFGVDNSTGLSGLLSGRRGTGVIKAVRGVPSLYVLPVGAVPPNPLELIQGAAFGLVIHELLNKFDHVVVDTPAAEYGADSAVVAARCGAALVVARRDKTRVADLQSLLQTLTAANAQVTGVVMNEF